VLIAKPWDLYPAACGVTAKHSLSINTPPLGAGSLIDKENYKKRKLLLRKDIIIRKESVADINQINLIHKKAFLYHPCSRGNEDIILSKMRHENGIVFSLVAEYKNMPIGNIIFSLLIVEGHLSNWSLLGPLAVLPEFQKQGIGSMLVRYGVSMLKSMMYDGCILFGDPVYYSKFGFTTTKTV
jgi:putative acetyltransferase